MPAGGKQPMPSRAPTSASDAAAVRPSKTQLKQQMLALQRLGEALTELPIDRLAAVDLPERLRDAIAEYRRTRSHEGRRRQLQYIGKLMRTVDPQPLHDAVDAFALGSAQQALQLHEAERWRLELVRDDQALERWTRQYPDSDVKHLRGLVQAARRDAALPPQQRNGRGWRELFRFVRPYLAQEGSA